MASFSSFEVEEKTNSLGKEGLLKEIPSYNNKAQEFYYKTIVEIEKKEVGNHKIELQKEANTINSYES